MKAQSDCFLYADKQRVEAVEDGIKRQILGYNDEIMMVKVWFEQGRSGYIHSHRHSQTTYVECGEFDVNVDGQVNRLKAGDSFYIPPNVPHGAECKQAGVLIDVFSPVREDFLKGEQ